MSAHRMTGAGLSISRRRSRGFVGTRHCGRRVSVPAGACLTLLGYGIATALTFVLTFAAMARLSPSGMSVIMTIEAVITAVLGVGIRGEGVTGPELVGACCVVIAAGLAGAMHDNSSGHAAADAAHPAARKGCIHARSLALWLSRTRGIRGPGDVEIWTARLDGHDRAPGHH